MQTQKHFLITLSFFLSFLFSQSQNKYVVLLKDKNNCNYSLTNPSEFLSIKAIERREKQNVVIDVSDVPVNINYINQIELTGVKILNKSKWLNLICISTDDSMKIEAIRNLSFVKEVQFVCSESKIKSASKFDFESVASFSDIVQKQSKSMETNVFNYGTSYSQANQINCVCLHNQGYQGQGMVVAVIDAGFYHVDSLPIFDSIRTNNQILGCRDFVTGDTLVYEDFFHGMSVLSCMAGNIPGEIVGTAPKAKYWLLRTEDAATETLIEEYNWLAGAEFADSVGADVINSSLGYSTFDGGIGNHSYPDMDGRTTIVSKAAEWASRKGILVVNSAGNSGGAPWYKITAPADADSILSVGAIDSLGVILGFSSRGLTYDGRIKPDVVARGYAAVVAGTAGGTWMLSGTSFSSPITAGAVTCLRQANPAATNIQLIQAIQQSATQHMSPDSIMGYGIPNFCLANYLLTSVVEQKSTDEFISSFPNPFTDYFSLFFRSPKKQLIEIKLMDITGRKIISFKQNVNANETIEVENPLLTNLSKGIYFLTVVTSEKIYTQKMVKE